MQHTLCHERTELLHRSIGAPGQLESDVDPAGLVLRPAVGLQRDARTRRLRDDGNVLEAARERKSRR